MKNIYKTPSLRMIAYQGNDIVTLSGGEDCYFDLDWAGVDFGSGQGGSEE